ncbi:MAG: hypothetical protein JSV26_06390 [bacterium]|nr:MAG: hypothetical protein JSV26_06390 [bacterium]
MNRYDGLSERAAFFLLVLVTLLLLTVGWHREISARYPLSDLPSVNLVVVREQVGRGNLSRSEARYYRMMHAGSDTAEIR